MRYRVVNSDVNWYDLTFIAMTNIFIMHVVTADEAEQSDPTTIC